MKKIIPKAIVIGNSISKMTSMTDNFPFFRASKLAIAEKKATIPKTVKRIRFGREKMRWISFIMNGVRRIEPMIPINARDPKLPIFLTLFCIRKSPTPQHNIAARAKRIVSSSNINLLCLKGLKTFKNAFY